MFKRDPVRLRPIEPPVDSDRAALEYWVTRTSAQSRTRRVTTVRYAAGTGSAVTDLIFSIAKREVTFFSGTAPISFL